jgi:hypothetical protein
MMTNLCIQASWLLWFPRCCAFSSLRVFPGFGLGLIPAELHGSSGRYSA